MPRIALIGLLLSFVLQPSLRWRARIHRRLCSKKRRLQVDSDSVGGGFEAGEGATWPVRRTLVKDRFGLFCLTALGDGTIGCLFRGRRNEAHRLRPLHSRMANRRKDRLAKNVDLISNR